MKHVLSLSVIALSLSACTGPASHTFPRAAAADAAAPIPFASASAERLSDGSGYRINWQAPGARNVRVYAGAASAENMIGGPVAQGGAGGSLTVSGPAAKGRPYFTLVPDRGAPLAVADRGLHLTTAPNFRDIGGYRTTDGRWVRSGLIYRSDQFDRLSDSDLAAIDALGPSLVVDLRTQSERASGPDRIPPHGRPLILDVAADASGTLGGDMRKAQTLIAEGKGAEMLVAANRDFVSLPSARAAYGTLLRRLTEGSEGTVIYHCTAGKDRTGWATAVILTLLGVPRETVMADYLLSNSYLRAKNEAVMKSLAVSGGGINPAFLEPVLTVRPEYLQSAFDEVDRKYGSFDAYARDGLGLSRADIMMLRRRYLTGSVQ